MRIAPNQHRSASAIARLVNLKGEASVFNTSTTQITLGYSLFIDQVRRLLEPSRGLMMISTADRGKTPSDRIGAIMRDMDELDQIPGFAIIDHIDNLLNDSNDMDEVEALMGLAKIWAAELGCHLVMLNRCKP